MVMNLFGADKIMVGTTTLLGTWNVVYLYSMLGYNPYKSLVTIPITNSLYEIFYATAVSEISARLGKFEHYSPIV
jgi:hypothetical protein